MSNFRDKANLIWEVADLLRGNYKQADYGKVILPFTVLRRLDAVLEPTKQLVLDSLAKYQNQPPEALEIILNKVAKNSFHNRSRYGFNELVNDHNNIGANREGLNFQQIRSFDIPVCQIEEQKEIVEFIESKTNEIDSTISKIEEEILLLKEYRTALISEVVTGKIKVV